jgi:hypothetical protein
MEVIKQQLKLPKLKKMESKRGIWHLTQVFNTDGSVAQNAGYIVFKDQTAY